MNCRLVRQTAWFLGIILSVSVCGCGQQRYQPAEWRKSSDSGSRSGGQNEVGSSGTTLPGTTLPGTTLPGTTLPQRFRGTTLPGQVMPNSARSGSRP